MARKTKGEETGTEREASDGSPRQGHGEGGSPRRNTREKYGRKRTDGKGEEGGRTTAREMNNGREDTKYMRKAERKFNVSFGIRGRECRETGGFERVCR